MRESRAVVGDCAIALHWVACALDSLRDRLTAYGGRFFDTEQHAKPHSDLERLLEDMDALGEELAATLGRDHDAPLALANARTAVSDIVETVGLLKDPNRDEVVDLQKFVEQTIARVKDQRERFDACREQFMAATRDVPREG